MNVPKESETSSEILTLHYDLSALPSAQHKAGLAGLLLLIDSMKMRKMAMIPEVNNCGRMIVDLHFTKESMQAVFDELFASSWVEVESATKWGGKAVPKRVVEYVTLTAAGKAKKEKKYVYDKVQPEAAFLKALYPVEADGWVKLWRDMLWGTLRGIPATRQIFEDRAAGKPCSLAKETWANLLKGKPEKRKQIACSISSSIFIGAQDTNAERVPFQGRAETNFLLYFWIVAILVFKPRRIKIDRKSEGAINVDLEEAGYVVVVPEPSVLDEFVLEHKLVMGALKTEMSGYLPRQAMIAIPVEGALEFLSRLAGERIRLHTTRYSLASVEIYHLEKQGNNIKMLASQTIRPDTNVIEEFNAIRDSSRNPIYKARRLINLLEGRTWYEGMDAEFSTYPAELFIDQHGRTPQQIGFFGRDVLAKFNAIEKHLKRGSVDMSEMERDDQVAQRVYRLIKTYVNRRTEEKSGMKFDEFKAAKGEAGKTVYPVKYIEAKSKVCDDAFLAMRGRRGDAFVEYFTGTICSVPQYLPEEDYLMIGQALITDPDRIKTLSMLSLSACSWSPKQNETGKEGE